MIPVHAVPELDSKVATDGELQECFERRFEKRMDWTV